VAVKMVVGIAPAVSHRAETRRRRRRRMAAAAAAAGWSGQMVGRYGRWKYCNLLVLLLIHQPSKMTATFHLQQLLMSWESSRSMTKVFRVTARGVCMTC
jgi:hypothetical protein